MSLFLFLNIVDQQHYVSSFYWTESKVIPYAYTFHTILHTILDFSILEQNI